MILCKPCFLKDKKILADTCVRVTFDDGKTSLSYVCMNCNPYQEAVVLIEYHKEKAGNHEATVEWAPIQV
jgi:hypothetical protein